MATKFPIEFSQMPGMQPPDMASLTNPEHDWMVLADWQAPALDGLVVCVRRSVPMPDGTQSGFWTDGVSVPQLAWSISGLTPFGMPEFCWALGHDIAYAAELAPKDQIDGWLLRWAKMAGTNRVLRNMAYECVVELGGAVWDKHTQQTIDDARRVCQIVPEGTSPIWSPIMVT